MNYKAVATCLFGLEQRVGFEIRKAGAENVDVHDGRVIFSADAAVLARANITSRCAERILILLSEYDAVTFDELFDGVKAIAWEDIMPADAAFPVKGFCISSTLSSVPACQSIIKKAVVERLRAACGRETLPETGVEYRVRFSIVKEHVSIMLDTSGDGLHKRGYRPLTTLAPIKETLAAGIADLARVRADSYVYDPFCGSGTLVIESALIAKNIAPGLNRRFAAENYSFIGRDVFDAERERARADIRQCDFFAAGADIDEAAVRASRDNARRAGVSDCVRFSVADALETPPPNGSTVITNPPYGERLSNPEQAEELYKALSGAWRGIDMKLYLITSHPDFEELYGRRADRRRKLYNGMINCQLYMYFKD